MTFLYSGLSRHNVRESLEFLVQVLCGSKKGNHTSEYDLLHPKETTYQDGVALIVGLPTKT